MKCDRCAEQATLHITEVRDHAACAELHLCDECGRQYTAGLDTQLPEPRQRGLFNENGECRLEVARVIISELTEHQVVVFRAAGGEWSFPLVIGMFEASAIDRRLKGCQWPRPLTHDAWFATVTALGVELQSVGIDALQDQTYFASLRLVRPGEPTPVRVDIRPSDAVVMALTARVPIFISGELFTELTE